MLRAFVFVLSSTQVWGRVVDVRRSGARELQVHAHTYIQVSLCLSDDPGALTQLIDWYPASSLTACQFLMQEQDTNPCATIISYSSRNLMPAHVPLRANRNANGCPPRAASRIEQSNSVARVTNLRALQCITRGKPIDGTAFPVTLSLRHLSSCAYPS